MVVPNQLQQEETNQSCSIYAFLNMILYDFGVKFNLDETLWIVRFMIFLGKLLPEGAYAIIIFPALLKWVRDNTPFDIQMETVLFDEIDPDDGRILGYKKANNPYIDLADDGELTQWDAEKVANSKGGVGHFHYFKRNTILESLGGFHYKIKFTVLKFLYGKGLYYPNCRRFYAGDEKTKKAQIRLIAHAKKYNRATSFEKFLKMYPV